MIYNYLSPSVIYVNICWFIEQPGLFPNCVNVFGFVWLGSSISHISFDPHVKLTIFPLIKRPSPKFQRNNPQMSCQMQNSPEFHLLMLSNWPGPYYAYDPLHTITKCFLATEPFGVEFHFRLHRPFDTRPSYCSMFVSGISDWCLYLAWVWFSVCCCINCCDIFKFRFYCSQSLAWAFFLSLFAWLSVCLCVVARPNWLKLLLKSSYKSPQRKANWQRQLLPWRQCKDGTVGLKAN